jgi:TatD DNase family protein
MLVDTHCHLADSCFDGDRDRVVARAREAGVVCALVVGENEADNRRILALAEEDEFVRPCAGHYPSVLDLEAAARTEIFIREHRDRLAAIGEVGIDHRITEDPDEIALQHEIFARFAALSAELDLPLSVHSRSAGRDAIAILRDSPARKVVLHAFDGKYGSALPGIEAGFHFSVPPSIVRSRQKQKLFARLPLERLLLESDAPVLGPEPGERNEPANIVRSARALAEVLGVALEEVIEVTGRSARHLFRLPFLTSGSPASPTPGT